MSFTYLASPYTPTAGEDIQTRVDEACRYAAHLIRGGDCVFSPIAHSHYVAEHLHDSLKMDHELWLTQDLAILRHCERVIVLCLPGWQRSKGIAREIEAANAANIPVEFVDAAD